jgi:RNA polymerase sigma factor (sigma-70 family)
MLGRRRDPTPIEPLFRAHFDAILRYAACRVGRDAALDVASETFVQALSSIDRLDPDRDPAPWLYGIATNVLRHYRRAEGRRTRAYATFALRSELADGASESNHLENDSAAQLVDGLGRLEPGAREALLLFAWADLTYDEIASALGIPVGTVRSRIHRAREALRDALRGAAPDDGRRMAIALKEEM